MVQLVKRKKKRKKIKYRKVMLKLSENQNQMIIKCSSKQGTTGNKLIKKAIKEYLDRHSSLLVEEPSYISKNQLKLFDSETQPVQLDMFGNKD